MAEPPELWTFLLFNGIVLVFGSVLTLLSYLAYRRNGRDHFRSAAAGFALVTLGGVVEPIYQLVAKGSHSLGKRELLTIQSLEGLLMSVGLGLLFYSIYTFTPPRETLREWEYDPDSDRFS